MPMIKYRCQCGHTPSKLVKRAIDAPSELDCNKCGKKAKRTLSSPASTSKITVDNGLQARAVEMHPNIEEINRERSTKPADRGD